MVGNLVGNKVGGRVVGRNVVGAIVGANDDGAAKASFNIEVKLTEPKPVTGSQPDIAT